MDSVTFSPLGQQTAYVTHYDPSLLFQILRQESRSQLNINSELPFFGVDIWTGYELSWLNSLGKPQVAVAEFLIPCDSPFIIESKSFKLYLNSLNQTQFASGSEVVACLVSDLSAAAGKVVEVRLQGLADSSLVIDSQNVGICLDELDVAITTYHPDPSLLTLEAGVTTQEILYSHLLKTNCPVTGQPDWATILIEYSGKTINRENLLRYIISFREHQDFHEHCVERIFTDIMSRCKPENLSVYARYTRRGGLDINPFRSTEPAAKPMVGRLLRQ